MTILVTGSTGFVGKHLVQSLLEKGYNVIGIDRNKSSISNENYIHYSIDLTNRQDLKAIFDKHVIDRVIHLAALAHSQDGHQYSWEDYYSINVECAKIVFETANPIPVLFISTVDVYGFTYSLVNSNSPTSPVSNYAKSKVLAENECKKLEHFDIFRLSPIYSNNQKRDIQKRYYLKSPIIAYQIGNGSNFEVLNINNATSEMVKWCCGVPSNGIHIIKDSHYLYTPEAIKNERINGNAKIVLHFWKPLLQIAYKTAMTLFGENKYTYLLHKAIYPIRTV